MRQNAQRAFAKWLLDAKLNDRDMLTGITGITIFCRPKDEDKVAFLFDREFKKSWHEEAESFGVREVLKEDSANMAFEIKRVLPEKRASVSFFLGNLSDYDLSGDVLSDDAGDTSLQNALDAVAEAFKGIRYCGFACYQQKDGSIEFYEIELDPPETCAFDFWSHLVEDVLKKDPIRAAESILKLSEEERSDVLDVLSSYRGKFKGNERKLLESVLKRCREQEKE